MHSEPLKSGYYTLRIGNYFLGRSFNTEAPSLLPKPIYNATDDVNSTWQLESLPGGIYRLRNFDAPVAAIEGRLEAVVSPDVDENENQFEWMITPQSHDGETVYTISTSSGDAWYTTSDKFSPIVVCSPRARSSDPSHLSKALVLLSESTLKSLAGYVINDDYFVGRSPYDNKPRGDSILPKEIFNGTQSNSAIWYLQSGKDGKYKLSNLMAPVAAKNGVLCAFMDHPKLNDVDPKFDWYLEPQFHQGSSLYTITNSEKQGWCTTSRRLSKIKVVPLPSTTKSHPPQYFPNALFKIVPFLMNSGFYAIRNADNLVGRASAEDHSLNPKPILTKTDNANTSWFIVALGPDRYRLSASPMKIGGFNPVGVDEQQDLSLVFAFLDPNYIAPEWTIIPQFNYGEDLYTIQLATPIRSDRFWFARDGKETSQIEIHDIVLPNPIPSGYLFKIQPSMIPI